MQSQRSSQKRALEKIYKLYKSSSNSKGNRAIFKDFFWGIENRLWAVQSRIFCKNDPTYLGGGCNFFASSSFLSIFSVIDASWDASRGGLLLLFGHHKQWGPLVKTTSKPYLNQSLMGCSTTLLERKKKEDKWFLKMKHRGACVSCFIFFETPILCWQKLMRKTIPCNHAKTKSYEEVFTIRSHDTKHKTLLSWKSILITKYYNDSIAFDVFLLSKPEVFLKKKAKWKDD
jgi:hypothetical protein